VQLVGIDQHQPGQHPGVDPVTFGMTLIVAAEIGDLLTIDQVDRHRLPRVIDGDGKPGHAGRFDHELHQGTGRALTCPHEQLIQFARSGVDGQDRGAEVPTLVQNHRFMGGLDG